MSNNQVTIIGARNAGRKIENIGQVGGIYTPASGTIPARFETVLMVNEYGGKDQDGSRKTFQQTYPVTIWNGNNSESGKGLADIFSKHFSVGKELKYAVLARRPYEADIVVNGKVIINDATGKAATHTRTNWILREFEFGPDSAKLINEEIAAWTGELRWGVRPPCFDGTIRPDANGDLPIVIGTSKVNHDLVSQHQAVWSQLKTLRNNLVFQAGTEWYGYAKVRAASTTTSPTTPTGTDQPLEQQGVDASKNTMIAMIKMLQDNPASAGPMLQSNPALLGQMMQVDPNGTAKIIATIGSTTSTTPTTPPASGANSQIFI